MTRPLDRHLDDAELDALVSLSAVRVSDSGQLAEPNRAEVQRHVEFCEDCNRKVQMHRDVQSRIARLGSTRLAPDGAGCPKDADWLHVAAGLVPETKARQLMSHAAQCDRCGPLLRSAAETLSDETTPNEESTLASLSSARPDWQRNLAGKLSRSAHGSPAAQARTPWWKGFFLWPRFAFVAGALAVAIVAGWLGMNLLHTPSAPHLLAQAYTEHRTLEMRIAGAKYAPMRVERSAGGSNLDKSPSLLKAEVLISENLRKNPNDPAWLQAKGRADLLDGNYESAIKSLQRALEAQPDSPQLLTDLASAYFERAEAADRAIDYGNAIEALGKALAKSPDDPVALFNRALACERMFLYTQAVDDWEHYLRVEPQGEWADEARKRLSALKQKLEKHEKSQAEPLLEPSEIAGARADDAALHAKIDERIEEYLQLAVSDWLPKAYPIRIEKSASTRNPRSALQVVAQLAAQKHADLWLEDVLSGAGAPTFGSAIAELAGALKANDFGDNVAARQYASTAERLFTAAGNYAGVQRARVEYIFAAHDAETGRDCVRSARDVEPKLDRRLYAWLRTQFHLEQGTCFWMMGNLGEAGRSYGKADRDSETGSYPVIYLRTQDHLSGLSTEIGDFAASAARIQSALARFWSGHYAPMRGYNLYFDIYEGARLTKRPHLQVAAWRDGLALSESFSDHVIRAMAHSAMADAAVAAGVPHVAEIEFKKADQLFASSPQIQSTRIARVEAETRLAEVEASQGKAQQAVGRLQRLEPEVAQLSDDFLGVLFYTTIGDAESRIGDVTEAESHMRSAIALAEFQLQSLHSDKLRIEWEARTSNAYRVFVQARLRKGDVQGALEIWELYRGAAPRAASRMNSALLTRTLSLPEPHEVTRQLPGLMKETVLSYSVLPEGLAVWVYDDRGIFVHWTHEKPDHIEAKADTFRRLCSDPNSDVSSLRQSARALYDLLVAPIEQQLSPGRALVVALDERLAGLPFEALIDAQGRYLGDRGLIVSSLGTYYRRNAHALLRITADSTALTAAVPVSSAMSHLSRAPLPEAVSESEMVAHYFHSAQVFSAQEATSAALLSQLPNAAVFHFAGHAFNSRQQSGLLLSDSLLGTASLQKISLSRMQLAVFSACDTQGGSTGSAYDSDSLVRAFLQAGVPTVVASRWSVDSVATRQFMELFYGSLLDGGTTVEAIHQAQSGLRSRPGMTHPYYWAAFSAFGTS